MIVCRAKLRRKLVRGLFFKNIFYAAYNFLVIQWWILHNYTNAVQCRFIVFYYFVFIFLHWVFHLTNNFEHARRTLNSTLSSCIIFSWFIIIIRHMYIIHFSTFLILLLSYNVTIILHNNIYYAIVDIACSVLTAKLKFEKKTSIADTLLVIAVIKYVQYICTI